MKRLKIALLGLALAISAHALPVKAQPVSTVFQCPYQPGWAVVYEEETSVVCHQRTVGSGRISDVYAWEYRSDDYILDVIDTYSRATDGTRPIRLVGYALEGVGHFVVDVINRRILDPVGFTEDQAIEFTRVTDPAFIVFQEVRLKHMIELQGGGDSLY